jgi:hypothetical protein
MDTEKHKLIEQRAYAFWEDEGQPYGRHEEHWHLAARQIDAEAIAHPPEKRKKRRPSGRDGEKPGRKKSKK